MLWCDVFQKYLYFFIGVWKSNTTSTTIEEQCSLAWSESGLDSSGSDSSLDPGSPSSYSDNAGEFEEPEVDVPDSEFDNIDTDESADSDVS